MKKIISIFLSLLFVAGMILSLSSCSKSNNEMTEENINATVKIVSDALKEFDTDTLDKYVESTTLDYILKFAEDHEQYVTLGKAIFKDMVIKVDNINMEDSTVTIDVSNRRLDYAASTFADNLMSKYSNFQLLSKLEDESFLDKSLGELVNLIEESALSTSATVTLKVKQGDRNLILYFDEEAENAVSGGALSAITNLTN